MRRPLAYLVAAAAAGWLLAAPTPARAELVTPAGACVGTASWQDGGFTAVSTDADPGDVIEIPRADQVTWSGRAVGPEPGEPRPVAGAVALRLPPPLGWVTVDSWQGEGVNVESSGVRGYDIPALVPAGVPFTLRVEHREGSTIHCEGIATLAIAGGPFDSPLVWIPLAGSALFGGLLLLTGRTGRPGAGHGGRARPGAGRVVTGGLLGSAFLGSVALSLLLLGVLPLTSPLLTLAPLLGVVGGGAWAGWSPLRAAAAAPLAAT